MATDKESIEIVSEEVVKPKAKPRAKAKPKAKAAPKEVIPEIIDEEIIEAVIEEVCDVINVAIDVLNAIEMKYPGKSEYIVKRFQEKLDKWESKINSNKFLEEYKSASDEHNGKIIMKNMNNIISEDMKTIGFIETMNGQINFK